MQVASCNESSVIVAIFRWYILGASNNIDLISWIKNEFSVTSIYGASASAFYVLP